MPRETCPTWSRTYRLRRLAAALGRVSGLSLLVEPAVARGEGSVPLTCEVDRFLEAAPRLSGTRRLQESTSLLRRVFRRDSFEHGVDDMHVWEYFLLRLAKLFRELEAPDILAAVQAVPSDGHASEAKCSHFYRKVATSRGFLKYHADPSRRPLLFELCFPGGSFEAGSSPPERPPALGEVVLTACEVDQFLDALSKMKRDERVRAVRTFVAKGADAETSDKPGAEFFFLRLASRYRRTGDAAILDGVDAVAAKRIAPGICYFYVGAWRRHTFAKHYRRKDRRMTILAEMTWNASLACAGSMASTAKSSMTSSSART